MNQSTDKLVPAVQQEGWSPESQPRENAASSPAVRRGRTGSVSVFLQVTVSVAPGTDRLG